MSKRRILFPIVPALILALALLTGCSGAAPQTVQTSPVPTAAPEHENAVMNADGSITVRTVDALLASIAPDTTIILEDNEYDLTTAENYGKAGGEYYDWVDSYDGYELLIRDVSGLKLIGENRRTTISTRPRYSNVLHFRNCEELTLESLVIGHTEEQGYCSGGVVYLESCKNTNIDRCKLYGCGTIGINAVNCTQLYASETDIYECSYNGVVFFNCYDTRLENCSIHDCGENWSDSVIQVTGSNAVALVNCNIYQNAASTLLYSSHSQQVRLLGCDIRNNSFDGSLFRCSGYSALVDGCRFENNYYAAFNEDWNGEELMPPTAPDGTALSEQDILSLRKSTVSYDGPEEAEPIALDETVNADGIREVHVKTVDELLAAIASDTIIYLDADVFDLSTAANYGAYGNQNYYWQSDYDGPGLVITKVENLTMIGNGSTISAIPRYVNVLGFEDCEAVTLQDFTAGHTEEPGSCSGGVLYFANCNNINITACHLYGCGIMGISAFNSGDFTVKDTEIFDCSWGAIELYTVTGASFENCDIHDCGQPTISLNDSRDIIYDGKKLPSGGSMFDMVNGTLEECFCD